MDATPVEVDYSLPGMMEPSAPTARRARNGKRISRFVFTLNNWTQEEYTWLTNVWKPSWMIIGKEIGDEGTPHLQGACVIGAQSAFSKIKALPGFRRAHIEKMMGDCIHSDIYCRKEDNDPYVYGEMPKPGKRNDLHDTIELIHDGATMRELAENVSSAAVLVRYPKGLMLISKLTKDQGIKRVPPMVFWFWGKTGTGKTRCALELGQLLSGNEVWLSNGGLRWFDGYECNETAILDDIRAKHVSGSNGRNDFAWFLRLLDRYPMEVEYKGGYVPWCPKYIFITTVESPETTFQTRFEHVPEDVAQLTRRITKVVKFDMISDLDQTLSVIMDFIQAEAYLRENPRINTTTTDQ